MVGKIETILILLLTIVYQSMGQVRVYHCAKVMEEMTIDGKDDENAWTSAAYTDSFVDITGLDASCVVDHLINTLFLNQDGKLWKE